MTTDTTPAPTTTPEAATAELRVLDRTGSADPAARALLEAIEAGVTPAPAAAAPAAAEPITPSEATKRILALRMRNDPAARAEIARLEKIEAGEAPDAGDDGKTAAPGEVTDMPPSSPNLYQLPYETVPGELDKAMDAEGRELFHAAGLPNDLARHIFKSWNSLAARIDATGNLPSPIDVELGARAAEATLRRVWGGEYDAKMEAAQSVLKALPPEKYERAMDILNHTGIGNDQYLVMRLAGLGERRAAKK